MLISEKKLRRLIRESLTAGLLFGAAAGWVGLKLLDMYLNNSVRKSIENQDPEMKQTIDKLLSDQNFKSALIQAQRKKQMIDRLQGMEKIHAKNELKDLLAVVRTAAAESDALTMKEKLKLFKIISSNEHVLSIY
jgi:hypothetical protein